MSGAFLGGGGFSLGNQFNTPPPSLGIDTSVPAAPTLPAAPIPGPSISPNAVLGDADFGGFSDGIDFAGDFGDFGGFGDFDFA